MSVFPAEVLVEIFHLVRSPSFSGFSGKNIPLGVQIFKREHAALGRLRLVSRHWNGIVVGSQSFWSTIYIHFPDLYIPFSLVEEWLSKRTVTIGAGNQINAVTNLDFTILDEEYNLDPISNYLAFNVRDQIFYLIKQHLPRLKHLHIGLAPGTLPGMKTLRLFPAGMLKSLSLVIPSADNAEMVIAFLSAVAMIPCPSLQSLTLSCIGPTLFEQLHLDSGRRGIIWYDEVRYLQLEGSFSILDAASFCHAPYLRTLVVRGPHRMSEHMPNAWNNSRIVTYLNLKFVELDHRLGPDGPQILTKVGLPNLGFLSISGGNILGRIDEILQNPFPSLEFLKLREATSNFKEESNEFAALLKHPRLHSFPVFTFVLSIMVPVPLPEYQRYRDSHIEDLKEKIKQMWVPNHKSSAYLAFEDDKSRTLQCRIGWCDTVIYETYLDTAPPHFIDSIHVDWEYYIRENVICTAD
ncbi:hypothetical protein NP233_g1385 [Leucocoprinus birnbaumii]|uniref:F-box domain-containing protein n=1 Tax=Leucocoprinus birnbaumii TaxID=56174 RepID=A0AAD5YZL3_9AGAR|nr:hypothetical protein NP233_g1385 [Leucocoprinus birnbaumii]